MKAKYFLIFVVCVLIYCIPLGAVISISNKEIKKYNEDKDFKNDVLANDRGNVIFQFFAEAL